MANLLLLHVDYFVDVLIYCIMALLYKLPLKCYYKHYLELSVI